MQTIGELVNAAKGREREAAEGISGRSSSIGGIPVVDPEKPDSDSGYIGGADVIDPGDGFPIGTASGKRRGRPP